MLVIVLCGLLKEWFIHREIPLSQPSFSECSCLEILMEAILEESLLPQVASFLMKWFGENSYDA